MDQKTKQMIESWLAMHNGDKEALALWMRDNLRALGGLKICRQLIEEALLHE